jgi:large subunit ribosomal protein L35
MPKMKSHSGAKKRFEFTKKGKVKYKKPGLRHLLAGEPPSQGRRLRKAGVLEDNSTDAKTLKKFLPYK